MFLFAEVGQENIFASLLDFRSNLVNWLLLIAIVFWLIKKYIPGLISNRQQAINAELELAAKTRKEAELALAEQKQKIEAASHEAEQIVVEARNAAKQMSEDLKQQTEKDMSDLLHKFDLAAHNERQAAIMEMRSIVAKAAIQLTQENLQSTLTANNKTKIAQDFMGELSKVGNNMAQGQTIESVGNGQINPQKVKQS